MSADIESKVHIMVDIETLDTEPSAVILSIGACTIQDKNCQEFYCEVHAESQPTRTRSIDTINWWSQQPAELYPGNGVLMLEDVLMEFRSWIYNLGGRPIIWTKGIDFDPKILAHAYKQFGAEVPWKYNDVRDFRTLKKMLEPHIPYPKNTNPHNALADAKHQTDILNLICTTCVLELR